jgi:lysozyme family protein
MNFDDAFTKLVDSQHEGGYVNDPHDRGGETYKGVARKMNPTWPGWQRIDAARTQPGFPKNLESDSALQVMVKSFYQFDYWGPAGCDGAPPQVKFDLFDTAVNGGVLTAIKLLQRAAGVADDGVLGARTLQAVQSLDPWQLLARFDGWRLDYLNDNPDQWARFGRGWAQRIAENLKAA